jgi:hypothetical protein
MRKTGPLSTCAFNARTGSFRTPLLQRQLDPRRGLGGAEFDAQVPLVPAECRPQMHPTSNLQAAAEALEQASTSDSFWVRVSRGRSPKPVSTKWRLMSFLLEKEHIDEHVVTGGLFLGRPRGQVTYS